MPRLNVEVWALPQVSGDWVIVGGACFCFRYSASGEKFLEQKDWNYGLVGVKADKEKEVVIGSKTGRTGLMNGMWFHAMPPAKETEPGESEEESAEPGKEEGEKEK